MERKVYSVDEKLFDLLLEENFDELNIDELQELFGNSDYEISDKWVFTSDKVEGFLHFHGLTGYKYFYLIDYENSFTYEIGIPDVSKSNGVMERQKCLVIEEIKQPARMIRIKKYIFDKLASGTQINNYLINNIRQVLIKSFTDFFDDEFDKVQNQVEHVRRANNLTEDKEPFFITYNVDPKQFEEHKSVVAENCIL